MTKTNNRYFKSYFELFDVTRNPLDALVYSFILNQAEFQKTDNPKIEQTFIQSTLKMSEYQVMRCLKELKEDGLLDYTRDYNNFKGKNYTTTKFTLKYEFKQESEPETAVSEPTNDVCSHEDEINQMGIEMMDANRTQPTPIPYNSTPKTKMQVFF